MLNDRNFSNRALLFSLNYIFEIKGEISHYFEFEESSPMPFVWADTFLTNGQFKESQIN